jgi:hypothetical protein
VGYLDAMSARRNISPSQGKLGSSIEQLIQISSYPAKLLSHRVARDTTVLREPFDPESTIVLNRAAKQYTGVVGCLPEKMTGRLT